MPQVSSKRIQHGIYESRKQVSWSGTHENAERKEKRVWLLRRSVLRETPMRGAGIHVFQKAKMLQGGLQVRGCAIKRALVS
jgi:hypothetical protein